MDGGSGVEQAKRASTWRTEVSWIVLHPDRAAVLVTDGRGPVGLPSTELSGRTWLGDAPVLTAALAELGLDAVLLGCRVLVEDHDTHVQRLTLVATLRPGPVPTPLGNPLGRRRRGARAGAGGHPDRTSRTTALGGARLVPGRRALVGRSVGRSGPVGHRPGRAAPMLGAVERAASPDDRRAGLVQGLGGLVVVHRRGCGHGAAGRLVPDLRAGPAGLGRRPALAAAGGSRTETRLGRADRDPGAGAGGLRPTPGGHGGAAPRTAGGRFG